MKKTNMGFNNILKVQEATGKMFSIGFNALSLINSFRDFEAYNIAVAVTNHLQCNSFTNHFILPQPSISSSHGLTFGINELDRLLGGLRLKELVVFHGSWMCNVLSELLCVRSVLPHIRGGLDSTVVFIDGGNIFDPYFISEASRQLGLKPEETLRKIWISRPFTSYQLTTLITEELPKILDREGSRLVVISNITSLYRDPDIGTQEAKRTFNRVTLFLWKLVRQRDIILVATSLSSRAERRQRLEQYLLGRADIAARVKDGNPHVKITLEKHPFKPSASVEVSFRGSGLQSLLEDFMEV